MDNRSCPIRKYWTSDMQLHAPGFRSQNEYYTGNEPFHSCTNVGEMHSQRTNANRCAHLPSDPGQFLENERTNEQVWTKGLTETINNISRECFDRLAKLENENKELRKQYQNLEAQITPLVKSLGAHERIQQQQQQQMQTEPRQLGGPVLENGKTLACGTNPNWRQFDAQIRELISVLVHTNIAQNDIREDCRYLKHRVSNLEQANSQLYTLIKQRYPEYASSCASLQQPVSIQLQQRAASISFLKSDIEHSGESFHASLEDMITEPAQFVSGSHGDSVTQQQAPSPVNADSLSDLHFDTPVYNGSGVLLTVPQSSLSAKPNSALYLHARRHSSELDYTTTDQTFLDQFIRPSFEDTLLRASSTPILPLFDQYSTRFHFFNGLEFPYSTECLHRPLHAFDHFTKGSHSCITSGHLSTDSAQEDAHSPSDSKDLALPISGRVTLGLSGNHLVPHAWLQMSVLPKTSIQRHPIGTRSHIILGTRSLPLYLNTSSEDLGEKDFNYTRSLRQRTSHMKADKTGRFTVPSSPIYGRQIRTYGRPLNPIEEVDSNVQSFYDLITSGNMDKIQHTNHECPAIASSSATVEADKLPSVTFERNERNNVSSVICKDQKQRYLHPLRSAHKLSLPNTKSVIYESRQSLDLETMLYQQEQLQKYREAQRNLRYVVFSDTELLTGKFTITSTDDSAIDSGDEEDMQSSRESFGQTDIHSPADRTLHPISPIPHAWISNDGRRPSLRVPNKSNTLSSQSSTETDDVLLPETVEATSVDEIARRIYRTQSPVQLGLTEQHAKVSLQNKEETVIQTVIIHTSDQSNDEICGSTTSRSVTPDVVNEKNRNNVPPPVIIYRRRFGLSDSGDINTAKRTQRSDILEADGPLEPTSPILAGHSSPENHSSDTDSCVYNPEPETVELPYKSSGFRQAQYLDDYEFRMYGKNVKFSGDSEGNSVGVNLENVPEFMEDWTSTLTKHTQPAKETSCSLSASVAQSLNTDSTCLRNETSKSDRPITVCSSKQNKISSTTATDGKGFDPRVRESSVTVASGNKVSSITRETNSHLKAPSHSVSPPSYSTTAYTHTTSRPSTSPRVRRTVGSVNNPPSDVVKTKPSTTRQSSGVSREQNIFRSSPNSPDQQGSSMRKYRMHVTPSVIKPERTSASPSSQADGKESSTSRHGSSDESLNATSTSSSSYPSQDVVNRSLVLRDDLHTMDRSTSAAKPLLCPPPIPPRTSSRNHVYQNKAVNITTSIPLESATAPQYRSSPLSTYSHVRNILDGNTGNTASARSLNLKPALARPNKHSNVVPMSRKGVIINENSRSRSRAVEIDSVHCQPLYSQSFSPVRRFQINQQDLTDYTYNSHPCSKHRSAAQYYTTQEDYRPTNIERYPERSDFIYHRDDKPATASPQLGKVHQFEQSRYSVGKRLSSAATVQRDVRSPARLGLREMGYKPTVNNQPYSLQQPIGWHSQDSSVVNRESYRSPKSRYQSRVYTREQPTG
ncbi:hypothetical protein EG68_01699 [Paragonimus skrjabini miyazakii]|uniref:Uncharacterized protein n=1 Tax=Paragonimus skrjabini miyazakii TaxID=59628 RepID=A0A8S9Z3G6_9TREM|nr:hypothetical protein EG68_01699 [Paragonimus skrjabini miyazakii]